MSSQVPASGKAQSHWRRLFADRRGAVAIYFVLTLIPLMVAVGAAVDISRAYLVKQRLCYALDAAGLAVGSSNGTAEQLNQVLQSYFTANYPAAELGVPSTPTLVQNANILTVAADATVDTTLMKIVGVGSTTVSCSAEITRSSQSLEVALVLDVTGSMSGQRIEDLKIGAADLVDIVVQDIQVPFYTKLAIAPYAAGVNVGNYAASVRGAIPPAKSITNIAWFKAASVNISGATKTNPVVVTANGHGFANGEIVRITGVNGMTQLNNNVYAVAGVTANTFQLQGVNGTGYNTYSSAGSVRSCLTTGCAPVVTAASHGFVTDDRVRITDVVGTTQVNNTTYQITKLTNDTFALAGISPFSPTAFSAYSSGGNVWCTALGCEFYYFTNASASPGARTFRVSNCVSERTGANAFTDIAPSSAAVGLNYPASNNPCLNNTITPLSSDRTALKNIISNLTIGGSTAGHIGMAWGWYLVSPNFGYLWPNGSQPAAYGTEKLLKIVVMMTDGAFNTTYCNGVISADSTSGSGNTSDHINCNAPNGDAFTQAQALCTAMKANDKKIIIYTVGFDVGNSQAVKDVLANCATDAQHAFLPETGGELKDAFRAIAQSISNLRLSK